MVIVLLLLAQTSKAQEANNSIITLPPLNAGLGYSVKDNAPVALATFDIANYKIINIEGGYAGRNKESLDEVAAVLSFTLVNHGALNFPILKYFSCRVGAYVGMGRINVTDLAGAKLDYGPSLTGIFQVKF